MRESLCAGSHFYLSPGDVLPWVPDAFLEHGVTCSANYEIRCEIHLPLIDHRPVIAEPGWSCPGVSLSNSLGPSQTTSFPSLDLYLTPSSNRLTLPFTIKKQTPTLISITHPRTQFVARIQFLIVNFSAWEGSAVKKKISELEVKKWLHFSHVAATHLLW